MLGYIIGSFIGGLCLNFMPCVLPILWIKASGISKLIDNNNLKEIKISSFGTFLGILLFFIGISLAIYSTKIHNGLFYWGFYLQSSFWIGLSAVLLVMILGLSKNNTLFSYNTEEITKNAFITGLLHGLTIPILGTPCCGSIMGSMIAIAVSSSNHLDSTIIIISTGIGFAFPYLLLMLMRNPSKIIPRPGRWMSFITNIGFYFSIATLAWLIYLFMIQIDNKSYAAILFTLMTSSYFVCLNAKTWRLISAYLVLVLLSLSCIKMDSIHTFFHASLSR